jgi:hypothetical protein
MARFKRPGNAFNDFEPWAEAMKKYWTNRPVTLPLLFLQLSSTAFGLDLASDPVARALGKGDLKTAYHSILYEEEGSKIAAVFSAESKQANSDAVLKSRLDKVGSAFDQRLNRELNSFTFTTYRQLASDVNLNEQDRMRLIIPMIQGTSRLKAAQKDTLKIYLKGLLGSAVSAKMKAGLMIQATRIPSIAVDGKTLLPFCRSADSSLRKAAYRGLICTIAHNKESGNPGQNQVLFDSLKGDDSKTPDSYQVLVLATIGEDYARDFLLSKCASDAVKLVSIIRHDPYLKHPGLVSAALAFSKDTPQGIATRQALRYGLREPAWVAGQIASGPSADSAKADELRKLMAVQTTAAR